MQAQDIADKLDRLADFHERKRVLEAEKLRLLDELLSPEIRQRMADIEAEFADKVVAADINIAALETEIRADLLDHGQSVRGRQFQAVWSNGRASWDDKGLNRYAEAHPDVLEFRRQGNPIASIRRVTNDRDSL